MTSNGDEDYLTTAEVARLLRVKPATVYAYVSRGQLRSTPAKGRRGSLFAKSDVDRLRQRERESRRPGNPLERVATRLSLLEDDQLYYRGYRATDLARQRSVESVAHLLWTGELADRRPFSVSGQQLDTVRTAVAALPPDSRLTDRLRVAAAVLGAADPLRFDLSPQAVVRAGETLVAALAGAISPRPRIGIPVADQLWPALTRRRARPRLLSAALVLLADHDLAVSTMAARVAASARAHPYAVVSAGLGALDARYHGVTSTLAYRFLADALADPLPALAERLRMGEAVPGFGHRVYRSADPRAEPLFALLREDKPDAPVLRAIDTITAELAEATGTFANADLALAALMHCYDMRPDAGEAIFAVARTVGWIAHAIEEYAEPALRFRPIGVYTGPPPPRV